MSTTEETPPSDFSSSFHSSHSNAENGEGEEHVASFDVENPSSLVDDESQSGDDDDDDESRQYCCEGRIANGIIRITQAMLWTPLAVTWIILVIVTGAIFFFFMINVRPLHNDYQAEQWLNYSIQALNVLFTYAAIANEPKRFQQFVRLVRLRGTVGVDWRGKISNKIFDYIPWWHRFWIVVNLNLNCIFQYVNQTFRIIYFTPELANEHVLEVNLFFALSFICAIIAPLHQMWCERRVRKQGRAPPGQELDPIQKFMGRVDFTYREVAVESYQYAVNQLKRRMSMERKNEAMQHDNDDEDKKKNESGKPRTERTMATSSTSIRYSEVDFGNGVNGDGYEESKRVNEAPV